MLGLRTDGPICGCYHLDLYLNSAPPRWAGFEHTGQRNRIEGGAPIGRRYPASTVNGASVSRRQWAERKNQSNAIINIGQDFHHLSHKAFSGTVVKTIKPKMNEAVLSRSSFGQNESESIGQHPKLMPMGNEQWYPPPSDAGFKGKLS